MSGNHVAAFEDNLLDSLLPGQVSQLEAQLRRGDGRELDTGPKGEPPDAHSVRSSAVLAMNALGRWLGYEPDCRSNLGRGRGGSDTLWTTYASVQSTGLPHSREYGGLRGERGGNGREHGPPQLTRPGAGPARRPT